MPLVGTPIGVLNDALPWIPQSGSREPFFDQLRIALNIGISGGGNGRLVASVPIPSMLFKLGVRKTFSRARHCYLILDELEDSVGIDFSPSLMSTGARRIQPLAGATLV